MNIHYCKYCNAPIDLDKHGNKKYCPDKDCYKSAKKIYSLRKYYDTKEALRSFVLSDGILESYYKIYGENAFVPGILLDQAGMDWQISKREIIVDGLPIKVIGNFSYCLFQNETVKIWKTLSLPTENQ